MKRCLRSAEIQFNFAKFNENRVLNFPGLSLVIKYLAFPNKEQNQENDLIHYPILV